MVRVKNRYIVLQIILEKNIPAPLQFNEKAIEQCILKTVEKCYGCFGLGAVEYGFRVKYCNEQTRMAILRCRHGAHRFVTSVLPLITVIGSFRAKFRTLYTGATIIHCNKFIVKFQLSHLDKVVGSIKSAKQRKDFIESLLSVNLE